MHARGDSNLIMKPSLNNAYARINRTNFHLLEFKRECQTIGSPTIRFYENCKGFVAFDPIVGNPASGLPTIFSILIGEAIYNLRSALDYLVYELAILDSGSVQHGTQFPIENSVKGWEKHVDSFLKGLSIEHKTIIESFQPYRSCNWTQQLRDLSNPDKHRSLTILRLGGGICNTDLFPTRITVNMNRQIPLDIAFSDGRSVIKSIEELKSEVALVLEQFKSEFF